MGVLSDIKKFVHTFNALNSELEELDAFNKKVAKMLKPLQLNKQTQREIKIKLQDLRRLILIEALVREKEVLAESFVQERAALIEKYNVHSGPEAIAYIAGEINERYNHKYTDDAKWVDLKVKLWDYMAKNHKEISKLEELKDEAKRLQVNYLMKKVEEICQALRVEEGYLREEVKSLKPENYKMLGREVEYDQKYQLLAQTIEKKIGLYKVQGRTYMLWAYRLHVQDCGGDQAKIDQGLLAADKYWRKQENNTLENLAQTAQNLRQEAGREPRKSVDKAERLM